ncbi:MAG: DUF6261 family protein [Tannerella sp.]|jgi:hypothetical protein|nr:DUF6261 family protein [Tannerella sp.]
MHKFIALNVSHFRLDNLEGLVAETITVSTPLIPALGAVGAAKLQTLIAANDTFVVLLNKNHGSLLTPQIREKDRERDSLFYEIRRTSKTARKSSNPTVAAAGAKMMECLTPFWNISKEPMMSQTAQISILTGRIDADPAATAAAATLGLSSLLKSLDSANLELKNLYNTRVSETADAVGPSATSIKRDVVTAYDAFCDSVEITLSALPSDALQHLFGEMNNIRRKYIFKLPVTLSESHTSVAPIAPQVRTGRHITPIPRVFYNRDGEPDELVFAQDFTVTYRNNVEAGEAKLLVHGKGKYTGTYSTHFHIVEKE